MVTIAHTQVDHSYITATFDNSMDTFDTEAAVSSCIDRSFDCSFIDNTGIYTHNGGALSVLVVELFMQSLEWKWLVSDGLCVHMLKYGINNIKLEIYYFST